jgi:hypothetical protein
MTVTMQHKGTCLNKSSSQRVVLSLAATERFLADFFSRHVTQSESVPFTRPCTHFKTLSILLRLVHAAFSALEIMTFKKNEMTKQRKCMALVLLTGVAGVPESTAINYHDN